jgi:hypothetical protein
LVDGKNRGAAMSVSYTMEEAKGADAALTAFKDWSNYLLVTTVGLLAWVGEHTQVNRWRAASVGLLCFSAVFGIFTLALVPLVREKIAQAPVIDAKSEVKSRPQSIYEVKPEFRLFFGVVIRRMRIKHACWPQHAAFIAGVVFYSIASIATPNLPERPAAKALVEAPVPSGTTKLGSPAVPAPATPTTGKH